jgi:rubrerythrin
MENQKVAKPKTLEDVMEAINSLSLQVEGLDLKIDGLARRQSQNHKQETAMAKTQQELLDNAAAQAQALAAKVEGLETVEDSVKALVEGLVAKLQGVSDALAEALKNQGLNEAARAALEAQQASVDAQIAGFQTVQDKLGALVVANTGNQSTGGGQ